jgi:hypothetical protein
MSSASSLAASFANWPASSFPYLLSCAFTHVKWTIQLSFSRIRISSPMSSTRLWWSLGFAITSRVILLSVWRARFRWLLYSWCKSVTFPSAFKIASFFSHFCGASLRIRDITTHTPTPIFYVCGATPKQVLHVKHLSSHDMGNTAVHGRYRNSRVFTGCVTCSTASLARTILVHSL